MPDRARGIVVVGYDGSPAAEAALEHAIAAVGDDGKLYVVHTYTAPGDLVGATYYNPQLDAAADVARDVIARLHDDERLAGVRWEPEILADSPARAIATVAETRGADRIVIGARGVGRVRALLGSVSHELIHLADRPVTIIPERMVAARDAATADVPTR